MKIGELETHPYADAFPLMEGVAYERFRDDVKDNGLNDRKIYTLQGKILDGRNRARAADELDLKVTYVPYDGDDALSFVMTRNFHRRQLNESQRAMVAAKLASLKPGRPKKDRKGAGMSAADAASVANVGQRSVEDAKFIREHGIEELVTAVERGDMTIAAARKLAELVDVGEQTEALAKVLDEASKKARGAAAERELKKRRPSNDEKRSNPGRELFRVIGRALEQLGASYKPSNDNGRYVMDIAYDEHRFSLSLEDVSDERAA